MRDMDHRLLTAAGMGDDAARSRAPLFDRVAAALDAAPTFAVWAPGRIELLGKHVDYGGGRSIVSAVERGFCFVATPRDDDRLIVTDVDGRQTAECHVTTGQPIDVHGWANYVATVARRVARNFPGPLRGADVGFVSDLPPAAGLSSSSALVVGIFLALDGVNALHDLPEYRQAIHRCEALGEYLGAIENGRTFGPLAGDRGVGTLGGNQDQTAILCCEAGRISRFGYMPARAEGTLPVPDGLTFAVAASGVEAAKTGAAMEQYNRASRLLSEVLQFWNRETGRADHTLMQALTTAPDAIDRLRSLLVAHGGVALTERFENFAAEVFEIVPGAWDAWARGDWPTVGRIVDRSQGLAERLLNNQVPETVHLARTARQIGAIAASAFGAGFGGSVWALVRRDAADALLARWRHDYTTRFPQHAARSAFFTTAAGPAAFEFAL
jgi:galactokinase